MSRGVFSQRVENLRDGRHAGNADLLNRNGGNDAGKIGGFRQGEPERFGERETGVSRVSGAADIDRGLDRIGGDFRRGGALLGVYFDENGTGGAARYEDGAAIAARKPFGRFAELVDFRFGIAVERRFAPFLSAMGDGVRVEELVCVALNKRFAILVNKETRVAQKEDVWVLARGVGDEFSELG